MSIQPIPPTSAPTTAGQLVSRAYQNDQALAAWLGDHDDRLTDLESQSGTSVVPTTRGDLPAGANLNDYSSMEHAGSWGMSSSIGITNGPPITKGSVFEVWPGAANWACVQRVTNQNGAWWREIIAPGSWSPWQRAATADEVDVARWAKGQLANGTDLNSLNTESSSGQYALSPAGDYLNNPLPAGVRGTLRNYVAVAQGGLQEVSRYATRERWVRDMTNYYSTPRAWGPWYRTDIDRDAVQQVIDQAPMTFHRRSTLDEGTDLDALRGMTHNGVWTISSNNSWYLGLPPGPGVAGMLTVVSTGVGDAWQRLQWRFNSGIYERYQRDHDGTFTEWRRLDVPQWDEARIERIEGHIELLGATAPVATMWEQAELVSSYGAGEAYLDRLARAHSDKRGIDPAKVRILNLGTSHENRPIRAIEMGDATKPAFMVMAAQHGDEISGREAALIWAREVAESSDPAVADALTKVCLLIVPTVNVDRINVSRLSATNTNLNRNWVDRTTKEVQAVATLFASHDVIAVIDAHEGGSSTDAQIARSQHASIPPSIAGTSQRMYDVAWDALVAAGHPVSQYPMGEPNEATASSNLPIYEHAATLLQENPHNATNRYWPPLDTRIDMYRATYNALFLDIAQNLSVYTTARDAA